MVLSNWMACVHYGGLISCANEEMDCVYQSLLATQLFPYQSNSIMQHV